VSTLIHEGAIVTAVGRSASKLAGAEIGWRAELKGAGVQIIELDVEIPNWIQKLKDELADSALDCVFVVAGSGRPQTGNTRERFEASFNLNFYPTVEVLEGLELNLLSGNYPSITVISSIAGSEDVGAPIEYSVAKSALDVLIKLYSRRQPNIRINAIAPGNVDSENSIWRSRKNQNPETFANEYLSSVPLKRLGHVDEISRLAAFIASPISSFITGAVLIADGGQTVSFK
jgi:NAD(P)-dependent dehydrogenase (short-subunit alcohol dehydrogenase family)